MGFAGACGDEAGVVTGVDDLGSFCGVVVGLFVGGAARKFANELTTGRRPCLASPPAIETASCSAMPFSMKRSG